MANRVVDRSVLRASRLHHRLAVLLRRRVQPLSERRNCLDSVPSFLWTSGGRVGHDVAEMGPTRVVFPDWVDSGWSSFSPTNLSRLHPCQWGEEWWIPDAQATAHPPPLYGRPAVAPFLMGTFAGHPTPEVETRRGCERPVKGEHGLREYLRACPRLSSEPAGALRREDAIRGWARIPCRCVSRRWASPLRQSFSTDHPERIQPPETDIGQPVELGRILRRRYEGLPWVEAR